MLKNVATLMLASEVSAEGEAKAARVAAAWAQDQAKEDGRTEWIADTTGACTDADDDIRALTTAVSQALETRDQDALAVTALTDVGGLWQVADAARSGAVADAVAAEGASGAAQALDDLDAAAEAERAAAQAYREKYQEWQALVAAATAAETAEGEISAKRAALEQAVSDALTAYTEANDRKTEETQALGALYCMLGGQTAADVTAGALPLSAANWWNLAAMQSNDGGFPQTPSPFDPAGSTAPVYCTVPAVKDDQGADIAGTSVVYWTKDTGGTAGADDGHLASEPDDGSAKWTLTLLLTNAQNAENNRTWCAPAPLQSASAACDNSQATAGFDSTALASTYEGNTANWYNAAGRVLQTAGAYKVAKWRSDQRTKETSWYGNVTTYVTSVTEVVTQALIEPAAADMGTTPNLVGKAGPDKTGAAQLTGNLPVAGTNYVLADPTPLDAKWLGFSSSWFTTAAKDTAANTASDALFETATTDYALYPGQLLALARDARDAGALTTLPAKRSGPQAQISAAAGGDAVTWATTWAALDAATLQAFHAGCDDGDQAQAVYKWWWYAQQFHAAVEAWWTQWDSQQYTQINDGSGQTGEITDQTNWVTTTALIDTGSPYTPAHTPALATEFNGTTQANGSDSATASNCEAWCTQYNTAYFGTAVATDYMASGTQTDRIAYDAAFVPSATNFACAGYTFKAYTVDGGGVAQTDSVCALLLAKGASVESTAASVSPASFVTSLDTSKITAESTAVTKSANLVLTTQPALYAAWADPGDGTGSTSTANAVSDAGTSGASTTLADNALAAVEGQAALEAAWLGRWWQHQYWTAIQTQLGGSGEVTAALTGAKGRLEATNSSVTDDGSSEYSTATLNTADSQMTTAASDQAALAGTTSTRQDAVDALAVRVARAVAEVTELAALATQATPGDDSTWSGDLYEAWEDRTAALAAFESGVETGDGAGDAVSGELAAATAEKNRLIGLRDTADGEQQGLLVAWNTAKGTTGDREADLTTALSGADLALLRTAITTTTEEWDTQQESLVQAQNTAALSQAAYEQAVKAKADAVLDCQTAAFDDYWTNLQALKLAREQDLTAIKEMLDALPDPPAAGAAGSRCEKALSNGTWRPSRVQGEASLVCDEGLCCGAARVPLALGTGAEGAWRTIETCQAEDAETYDYQPARAPMAATMPDTVSVPFQCIQGAQKLAAAASALAAAVYMLA